MRLPGRRRKRELYKELQSGDAGLTQNDVTTDEQVRRFTNSIVPVADDRWGEFKP